MATQAIEATDAAPAAAPPKGKGLLLILAASGLLGGAGVGLFVVGPMFAGRHAAAPDAHAKPAEAPSSAVMHEIQNLVLNPAGTEGRRFLMVTATFQLKDAGTEATLKDHEAEVRDRILALLGKKTVEELSDMAHRDAIKAEIIDSIAPMFPKGSILKVFFPQFVIQ